MSLVAVWVRESKRRKRELPWESRKRGKERVLEAQMGNEQKQIYVKTLQFACA